MSSSSEINHYFQEYKEGVTALGDLVRSLDAKSKRDEKNTVIAEFDKSIEHLKEVEKSFKLETRLLKDRSERSKYEAEGGALEKKIVEYEGYPFLNTYRGNCYLVLFHAHSLHR